MMALVIVMVGARTIILRRLGLDLILAIGPARLPSSHAWDLVNYVLNLKIIKAMKMSDELVNKYRKSDEVALPYRAVNGITIENYVLYCASCSEPTINLRGDITEHPSCLEHEIAGVCYKCKLVTWSNKTRWYLDGHSLTLTKEGWVEGLYDQKESSGCGGLTLTFIRNVFFFIIYVIIWKLLLS